MEMAPRYLKLIECMTRHCPSIARVRDVAFGVESKHAMSCTHHHMPPLYRVSQLITHVV